MNEREALKMALEALTNAYWPTESDLMPAHNIKECAEAITAIREALAQPEQEPVAWMSEHRFDELRQGFTVMTTLTKQRAFEDDIPLYTTPPQRTWQGLTDQEIEQGFKESWVTEQAWQSAVWWAEAKLKEKNNG